MSAPRRIGAILLRLVCYPALLLVIAGGAALAIVTMGGACPVFTETRILCDTPFHQRVAEFAIAVTRIVAITGVPLLFGLVGAVLAVRDLGRWRRGT